MCHVSCDTCHLSPLTNANSHSHRPQQLQTAAPAIEVLESQKV